MAAQNPLNLFDRRAVRRFRERAARNWGAADFLVAEIAERLADRLDDVTRKFPLALDLGARGGVLARILNGRGGIERLIEMDLAFAFRPSVVGEAEMLPFAPASVDLILSVLDLHHVNDLPGALLQLRQALKPEGLLLASLFAGETLSELRRVWMEAELTEQGGAGLHVSPFADARDLAGLLQRAGFAEPIVDSDTIEVSYDSAFTLMRDLRAMGESHAATERGRGFTRRATMMRVAEIFAAAAGPDGRVAVRFDIATLTAWAPSKSR